jgi:hypothetical protein
MKQLKSEAFEKFFEVRPAHMDNPSFVVCRWVKLIEFAGQPATLVLMEATLVVVVLNLLFKFSDFLCLLAHGFGTLLDAFSVLGGVGMDFAAEITLIGHLISLLQVE